MTQEIFRKHVIQWGLIVEGEPIKTLSSVIYFVRYGGRPAVLKIFKPHSDEKNSAKILMQYNGQGAVDVLKASEEAILLNRINPGRSLTHLVLDEQDDQATHIFCGIMQKLHAAKYVGKYAAPVAALAGAYDKYLASGDPTLDANIVKKAKTFFKQLCATQKDLVLLHGDLHHDNILYDDARGWLSIDPKGYLGEAEFKVAAFLKNPQHPQYYADEKIARRRINIISETLKLNPPRILAWSYSYYVMSTIWAIEDKHLSPDWQLMLTVLEKMIGTKILML